MATIKVMFASAALAVTAGLFSVAPAQAVTYTYVGSWAVDQGPVWNLPSPYGPPVFTGQQAAALLFGGNASDYAISTNGSNPANINFSAWEDGWDDENTYAYSGTPAAENYSLDEGGLGYNSECYLSELDFCSKTAYSAYVSDHGVDLVNYAFTVSSVPEPATWAMMILGIGGLGMALRSRRLPVSLAAAG